MIPLVDLKTQYLSIKDEIDTAIQGVIHNTSFIMGEEVKVFEYEFASYCGTRYCIGLASGTAALHLSLLACGVEPGDEVITTTHTFIATAEAISHCGAKPVFVDVEPLTYNIDVEQIERAITPKTKAIIPVHLYGHPADMHPIIEIAKQYNLKLIEDAAQAHGAEINGVRVGNFGDLACFSFYPGKNLGAYGDAGAVVTNDEQLAKKVAKLRNHGRESKYKHDLIGYGERLDTLQAAILSVKLRHLESWTESRRKIASEYRKELALTPLILPEELPGNRHVYHLFVVRTDTRDGLLGFLKESGIGVGVHYPIPLHLQPAYQHLGYKAELFQESEKVASEVLSLPLYPELGIEKIRFIAEKIKMYFENVN